MKNLITAEHDPNDPLSNPPAAQRRAPNLPPPDLAAHGDAESRQLHIRADQELEGFEAMPPGNVELGPFPNVGWSDAGQGWQDPLLCGFGMGVTFACMVWALFWWLA